MSSASRRRPSIAGTVAVHVGSRANVRMASSGERGCTASPGDVVGVAHHLLRELVRLRRSDDDVIPLLEQPLHLLAERAVLARMLLQNCRYSALLVMITWWREVAITPLRRWEAGPRITGGSTTSGAT